jgi:hypothetical protein
MQNKGCLSDAQITVSSLTGFFLENTQVYQLSIGAACRLTWPVDRLIVQVLDDSTDAVIKVSEIGLRFHPLLHSLNAPAICRGNMQHKNRVPAGKHGPGV